ncbi:MAG: 16S rRNA (cytosine(1402)-N(4))-methyltransferase RsmH [Proteobacteria bacterium]|nr:16S rRNA (cytosine(1402)-N(4))-methyltransferase RsmH [Pseudomonadota bacterium]
MHVQPDGTYIDATFGRGGHSRALLERLGPHGRLIVFDRDPEAIACARELAAGDARVSVVHAAFSSLAECGARDVDGVLFDLGISSPQVDDASRGFSFRQDGPLDMRMDPRTSPSAAEWLANASDSEIADVLFRYGDERRSRLIAKRVVEARRRAPLTTTLELAKLIHACFPHHGGRIDNATRSFQALRIFINDEMGEIEHALAIALGLVKRGGRVLVIAFHSLEDRYIKHRFRELDAEARNAGDGDVPRFRLLMRKSVQAGASELAANPRARSARLRVLERVA